MVRKIEQFEASDGAMFDSRAKAEAHEARIKPLSPFAKFWEKSYGGDSLRKAGHTLESVGVWRIEGEGPVDFGSTGAPPYIATVSGSLRKAIEFAVMQPNFWGWGGGGYIRKLEIIAL